MRILYFNELDGRLLIRDILSMRVLYSVMRDVIMLNDSSFFVRYLLPMCFTEAT